LNKKILTNCLISTGVQQNQNNNSFQSFILDKDMVQISIN